jgi:hypothetical protein
MKMAFLIIQNLLEVKELGILTLSKSLLSTNRATMQHVEI